MKPKLIILGTPGRMGVRIVALAKEADHFDIIATVEKADHPNIGKGTGDCSPVTIIHPG